MQKIWVRNKAIRKSRFIAFIIFIDFANCLDFARAPISPERQKALLYKIYKLQIKISIDSSN